MKIQEIGPGVLKLTFGTPEKITPATQFLPSSSSCGLPAAALPFAPESILFTRTPRGCRLEIPHGENEDIYGFGLQLKSLCQTGKKRVLRVNSDPACDLGDSHAPVPLYFTTAGYGVLVDSARYITFFTGANVPLHQNGAASGDGEIHLTEAELYAKQQDDLPIYVDIPVAQGIDVYLFAGPTLKQAVQRYVLFCGGGCLIPEWGLGIQYRMCGTGTQKETETLAEMFRREKLPCDVIGLEPGWQTHAYACSLKWSHERFPQPRKLLDSLHAAGFHLSLWQHLFLDRGAPIYRELEPLSGNFKVFNGIVPDLFMPEAAQIYADYQRKTLVEQGVDTFKLDECDGSDYQATPWSFPECTMFPSGCDGEIMHSLLGVIYQRTIAGIYRQAERRTFGNVRNSHAFAASLPFVLYSDLYDHRDFLRGMTTAGFCGLLWAPELRNADSEEDYCRRLQSLVLAPHFLINSWNMKHPPWEQLDAERNRNGERYGKMKQEELKQLTRRYSELRMSFLPYLYHAFMRYYFEGVPPFRALVMDEPDNPALRQVDRAWFAGEDLLALPMTAAETEVTIPLPSGIWFDFFSGKAYEKTAVIHEPAILVRNNTTIPFATPIQHTAPDVQYELQLRLYGEAPRPGGLFADDGVTFKTSNRHFGQVSPDGTLSEHLRSRYQVKSIHTISR